MKEEGEPGPALAWCSVGDEQFSPKGISTVVRPPFQASTHKTERLRISDFFTYNGTAAILAHRILPSQAAPASKSSATKGDVESCKVCITAASAADCGVTALASAEAEAAEAPLQLFVGLTNGQLWHMEMKQHQDHHNSEQGVQKPPRRLSVASKQLLCCRMAEPVDMACCYVQREGITSSHGDEEPQNSSTRYTIMLIALYSDGVAVASWPETCQTTELPAVDGGCRLTLSPKGDRLAISTRKRRLVLLERAGRQFTVLKDFSPLKLTGPADPAAQPTWVGEEKLLLPGGPQLRCVCKASAWEEAKEAPALTDTGAPSHLVLLQHCGSTVGTKALNISVDADGEPLVCAVSTTGRIGIWRMQQKEPLVMIQGGGDAQLRSICWLATNSPLATLVMLRNDGRLGLLALCPEDMRAAIERSATAAASAPASVAASAAASPMRTGTHKTNGQATYKSQKPTVEDAEAQDSKNHAASARSVKNFLSREAAEASGEETESEAQENDLFSGMDPEERTPPKKRTHKHRRRTAAGADAGSQSSDSELGGSRRASIDDDGVYGGGAGAFATSLTALQSELQEAQAMLNALIKKQHETKQRLIHPGGGPQPKDPGKSGVVLAASGSSRSVMEFRCFLDAGSWVKHFAEGETIVAVAAGDSFVAAVTEDRTLRIFTLGGVLLYTADVFGRPVSLCGSQQLLVVLTQTGCSDGFLQLHCSVLHVHPTPSCPNAAFRLPISCFKRRLAAPPAAAASMPDVDIIHEGFFDLEAPLDWIGVSPGGMPAVKDVSGKLGAASSLNCCSSMRITLHSSAFYCGKHTDLNGCVVLADGGVEQGELGVVRLKGGEESLSFPDCSVSEAFFGYTMEHIPLRIPSPDLWSYPRWQRLLRQDKQLKGVGDGGGDAALVPWPQYDELRLQQEMAIRQLNHFVSICGGSAAGGVEGDAEAREAQRKLQVLSKRHDKFCLRGFAKCTDDKRWQQLQQQQQRRGGDGGLAALFDGQKRRASESNADRASKKAYFHKAD
ncbi:hypothetical protein, conserved [Eimeria praecox]|uniref:WDHD1/CFT4 second beta-propeller domain-containing protein n=1 Tax=Eimeria praecox TaxID=51316 RepID=U6G0U9_9EIME|nr:hypothetical protein, conserved [Eimeria praecox]